VQNEIPDFDLLRALRLAESKYINNYFQAYVDVYLTDEIRNEGLVRNLPGFARFLDIVGITNGEMVNANNIARDCGVNRNTVQDYYQILVDTLLGYFIYPHNKKIKRDLITATPKFYLFDVGVANYLAKQSLTSLKGMVVGKSFEHFLMMELTAFCGISRKQFPITYWRTKTGLEVDFILGDADVAIEVKISDEVHREDLKGLVAFCEEHPKTKAIVVSRDKSPRKLKINDEITILILPWKVFLDRLWDDEII